MKTTTHTTDNNHITTKFNTRWLALLMAELLVLDGWHTFDQCYRTPIDGDLAGAVVPAEDVKLVLGSPFGLRALLTGEMYPNPNKHFAHLFCNVWFNHVPLMLQRFVSPIDSAYMACAIARLIMQIAIVFLLTVVVVGHFRFWKGEWLLVALLVTPFMQTFGYRSKIGLVDTAVTYSFFYALPTILLIVYLMPLILNLLHGRSLPRWLPAVWWIWLPVCTLNGPLNPGIALVLCVSAAVIMFVHKQRPTAAQLIIMIPLALMSLYSLYLGTYNSINDSQSPRLLQRYASMPAGLWQIFSTKLAWPVLTVALVANSMMVSRSGEPYRAECHRRWMAIGLFSLLYLILLPLGGYREYRPNIVRYDTIIPVTLCMIYMYTWTAWQLLNIIGRKRMYWYVPYLLLISFIFTNADNNCFEDNSCERAAIEQIAASKHSPIAIECDCKVMEWQPSVDPENSRLAAQMLVRWNILDEVRLWYHPEKHNDYNPR